MAFTYTDPGDKGYFGMLDYNELKGQGLSDFRIRDFAKSRSMRLGPKIQEMFSGIPTTPTAPSGLSGISPKYGVSSSYFGHADYGQALSSGYNPSQVLEYLNRNRQLLRGGNVPGGGGLYDEVVTQANAFQQQQQQQRDQERAFNLAQMQIQEQRRIAEQQMQQQQRQMQQQQRQLQISAANQGMSGSGEVQFSQSKADRKKLTTAGTRGYFGRGGLRIQGLNVGAAAGSAVGSFA